MSGKILAFGEIMLRLAAPDGKSIRESNSFGAVYGGTEANVLACLSAFGHDTKYLTALPEGPLGEAVLDHLARLKIDTSDVLVRGDTLGLYFSENGTASRGANVLYYRRHSEFTRLDEQSFLPEKVFTGVILFHISGISFALSESSRCLAFRLMREARKRKIPVSFDFNYRASLWTTEMARGVLRAAAAEADILLASRKDLDIFLQMNREQVFQELPCRLLALRDRTVLSPNRHAVQLSLLWREGRYDMPDGSFPGREQRGGGDAVNGALRHALLNGKTPEEAAEFAIAAFALKHTIQGDTFTLKERDVAQYQEKIKEQKL